MATAAFSAGGNGYVVKSDAASELLAAVEAVMHGKEFVSSSLRDHSRRILSAHRQSWH
jgi:DNA-binding NarL/FixJ family response regulator